MSSPKQVLFVLVQLFVVGVLISASSDSYFGIWVGIELSSLAIYPWLVESNSEMFCSSLFKYLVVQVVASSLLYLGAVILQGSLGWAIGCLITAIALHVKLGSVFVNWVVCIIESISWVSICLLLGVQKVPLVVVLVNMCLAIGTSISVWIGVVVAAGSWVCCMVLSIRVFLVISSLLNMGWIWCGLGVNVVQGMSYFVVYLVSFVLLCLLLSEHERSIVSSVYMYGGMTSIESAITAGVSGLPPFAIFFCKAGVIYSLVESGFIAVAWIMMMFSVLLMYVYMVLILSSGMFNNSHVVGNEEGESTIVVTTIGVFSVFCLFWVF